MRSIVCLMLLPVLHQVCAQAYMIGGTPVEVAVAVDSSHFAGGYASGPWDLHWGPDSTLWFSNQRKVQRYDPATDSVHTLLTRGSGYILGLATHRDFAAQPYVYLAIDTGTYYAQSTWIELYRYTYSAAGDSLHDPQLLLHWWHPGEHCGGRMVFGLDGHLYVSTAEYWPTLDTLGNNSGRVLRLLPDGGVPADNPRPDLSWSYGHRNPQGILQLADSTILVYEYGQLRDELNRIVRDANYGWPRFDGDQCMSYVDTCAAWSPLVTWPVYSGQSPGSGITWYDHPSIPELNGVVAAITGLNQGLRVFRLNAAHDSLLSTSPYLTYQFGRVRDACAAPDGALYFIARDRVKPDIRVLRAALSTTVHAPSALQATVVPNPADDRVQVTGLFVPGTPYRILSVTGGLEAAGVLDGARSEVAVDRLPVGMHLFHARGSVPVPFVVVR